MKKSIAKTAAIMMAVMLAGTAVMPATVSAVSGGSVAATSDKNDQAMKDALTTVKKRVNIPDELSEFTYSTSESYGTKGFNFQWRTPDDAEESKSIEVTIVGDIIIYYNFNQNRGYSSEPRFAKLTEEQLLEKAKEYLGQLDPSIVGKVKMEISHFGLNSNNANISITRYENGVKVNDNNGSIALDKDTGELMAFSLAWADNASFADPKTAKTEAEIQEAYKKLCKLTPYYRTTRDWQTGEVTARIVYQPDMWDEIDAFTGKSSTIWEDMKEAEGTRLSSVMYLMTNEVDYEDAAAADAGAGVDNEVIFTEAELKKIQQDENLLTKEQVFELLKKDKFVALTDDYAVNSYSVSSGKDYEIVYNTDKGVASLNKEKETEHFYISANYRVKKDLRDTFKGYQSVTVYLDAETGEIISMNKWSSSSKLPKLDVEKANAIANEVAGTYGKDIIKEFKASKDNAAPVQVWNTYANTSDGKRVETEEYETSRLFKYARYVNGIEVYGDRINVSVDSNGVVTQYNYTYTEAAFPSADDILTTDQAFDKLYQQQKFNYYYDGWVAKDGSVKTYLIYKMDSFYLNAKTGKLCNWDGSPISNRASRYDVKYSDIKGIPQEQAILTLQKYGVGLTNDSKFDPTGELTGEQFRDFLFSAIGGYVPAYNVDEVNEMSKTLTREMAAVIFADFYDRGGITKLTGIFRTPFSDVKSTDENAGAIAVAYAKGFIGKGDGKFNGSKKVTRAEAAQMVYDYILFLSKAAK